MAAVGATPIHTPRRLGSFAKAAMDRWTGRRQGLFGSMRFDDGRVLEFEVLNVARKSAMLRLAGRSAKQERLAGQAVELVFEQSPPDQESKDKSRQSPIAFPANVSDDKFVPLLAPPKWTVGLPKSSNIFHGQIRIRQMLQIDNEDLLDYGQTLRLPTSIKAQVIHPTCRRIPDARCPAAVQGLHSELFLLAHQRKTFIKLDPVRRIHSLLRRQRRYKPPRPRASLQMVISRSITAAI